MILILLWISVDMHLSPFLWESSEISYQTLVVCQLPDSLVDSGQSLWSSHHMLWLRREHQQALCVYLVYRSDWNHKAEALPISGCGVTSQWGFSWWWHCGLSLPLMLVGHRCSCEISQTCILIQGNPFRFEHVYILHSSLTLIHKQLASSPDLNLRQHCSIPILWESNWYCLRWVKKCKHHFSDEYSYQYAHSLSWQTVHWNPQPSCLGARNHWVAWATGLAFFFYFIL